MNVYSSFIYSSQKPEATQMSINWWMNKQIMVHPYNRMLLSNKKKETTDTCNNMDEYKKHCAMRKKPDWKDYILNSSIHMTL